MTDNAIAESDAAHKAAQLKDEAIRWRQWAIEKLLASPALGEAFAGQGVDVFTAADDLVSYVTTGEHPGGEERS